MRIARLDHLVLTVASIARTVDFYTRALGLEVVTFGQGRTALRFGEQKINLHEAGTAHALRAARPTPGSGDFCLISAVPIQAVVAHLEAVGIPIEDGPGPRAGATGPITSVYVRDPDGNLVEVSTCDEPR